MKVKINLKLPNLILFLLVLKKEQIVMNLKDPIGCSEEHFHEIVRFPPYFTIDFSARCRGSRRICMVPIRFMVRHFQIGWWWLACSGRDFGLAQSGPDRVPEPRRLENRAETKAVGSVGSGPESIIIISLWLQLFYSPGWLACRLGLAVAWCRSYSSSSTRL